MTRIDSYVVIPASLEEVFLYASDYRFWPDWFEGVSEFTPIREKTRGNGARYAYRARMMGFPIGLETEIQDFIENRGWTGVCMKGASARAYWSFESIGDETKFTYALEYQMPVPVLGSLLDSLFLKPRWNKIIAHSLHNLREHFAGQSSILSGD
jgi:hypothetical protein